MRVAVRDALAARTVLRVRTRVDVGALGTTEATMAAPHIHGCQAAMALRVHQRPPHDDEARCRRWRADG